jgi:uncharacterized membrane protein
LVILDADNIACCGVASTASAECAGGSVGAPAHEGTRAIDENREAWKRRSVTRIRPATAEEARAAAIEVDGRLVGNAV